jgi:tight adherence protein B
VFAQQIDDPTFIRQIESYIDRSGVKITLVGLMVGIVGLTVITFGIYTVILPFASPILVALAALISGMGLPFMYLRMGLNKRVEKFQEQFPDAVDLMARSLRIGHPISAALENIAEEMADPIGHEFRIITQAIAYGKNVPDAIEDLLKRVDISDVRFFVVAIQIHHESGGNLGEILGGLSKVIRSRFHLHRKVKALTVEGRFSAWFLSAFPVVMIFGMNLLQPGYYENVSDNEYFDIAVAVTFGMLLVNVVAMRMMTKLEV